MNYSLFNDIDYFTNFSNLNNNSNNNSLNNKLDLYQPYEGFIKGNLFKNLYKDYKNYKIVKINITSEQEEELLNIYQIGFFCHELNLYLDNYSNNLEALNLFNKYTKMYNELVKNYERKYGPLNIESVSNTFKWVSDKWPWEN